MDRPPSAHVALGQLTPPVALAACGLTMVLVLGPMVRLPLAGFGAALLAPLLLTLIGLRLVSRIREARHVAHGLSIRFTRQIANTTRFALLCDRILAG